jgi:hypothetical protein
MRKSARKARLALSIALLHAPLVAQGAQDDPFLREVPPGYPLYSVSADGLRVAGHSLLSPFHSVAVYFDLTWDGSQWIPMLGPSSLIDPVLNTYQPALWMSDDGTVIGIEGFANGGNLLDLDITDPPLSAFAWTAADGAQPLSGFVSPTSRVAGLSADGSAFFGAADGKAAQWIDGAPVLLTPTGHPDGITGMLLGRRADGKLVGAATSDAAIPAIFLSDGSTLEPVPLPDVGDIHATRASANGAAVIGTYTADGVAYPFRWMDVEANEFVQLTASAVNARPTAVSADGNVVVGTYDDPVGGRTPFVWDPILGFRSLETVMAAATGLGNVSLLTAEGVSSDGRTVVGLRDSGNGFVARLPASVPEPSTSLGVAAALLVLAGWGRAQRSESPDSAAGTS